MSYTSIVEMGNSQSLAARIAACAAEQGNSTPRVWAADNIMRIVADPANDFAAAWDYARNNVNINFNPDLGARTDVIGDNKILAAVQSLKTAQAGSQGWPA